jgi:hypothetical protein
MTPEQKKRVAEIAENKTRKFCIETNMEYLPNFMYMANIAILHALDDPLLRQKNEYICKCGLRVTPHRCKTGEEF